MQLRPHLSPTHFFVLLSSLLALSACKGRSSDPDGNGAAGGEQSSGDTLDGDTCNKDEECDDHIYCNGQEQCSSGFCRQGRRVECDDGVECTVDRCEEDNQKCVSRGPDLDFDGFADISCEDAAGKSTGQDCDDDDPLSYPGSLEVCDPEQRDEDCDPTTIGERDADNDGYNDALCCNEQPDGELSCGRDCDDHKPNVNPESPEVCDFLDNDCNEKVDEKVAVDMFPDTDHDGHGDDSLDATSTCPGAVGYSLINDDCDDSDPEVFTGQFEICDDKDNNCDSKRLADEIKQQAPWYKDTDGDTYGDPESTPVFSCYRPEGRVLSQNDCADGNKRVNPNATEICDALDNDCNGWPDAKAMGINNFEDDDRDLVADADCDGGLDCDDTDPRTAGGAEEVCDHIDNDCDAEIDEQTVQNIWYIDQDGDGWGVVIGSALASCDPIAHRASKFGDCDDTENSVHPDVTEICDGVDQDCDGLIDEGASVHCETPNALTSCSQGSCKIFSCTAGFSDADNEYDNGCEKPAVPVVIADTCVNCDNGNLCDGIEYCVSDECFAGAPIDCGSGGSVIEGDVVITNSLDIKAIEGVQTITGNLTISGTSLITLVGLESLTTIGGSLTVTDNDALKKLSGSALSNLEIVGGDINISYNNSLTSVDLPSLLSARVLDIRNNSSLVDISGYEQLVEVRQRLSVTSNLALKSIAGFSALNVIGGKYTVYRGEGDNVCDGNGGFQIAGNTQLTELTTFSNLQVIDGDLCIFDLNSRYIDYQYEEGEVPPPEPEEYSADDLSTELVFPSLGEVGGGLVIDQSTNINLVDFPKLKTATLVSLASGNNAMGDAFMKISMPRLSSVESFELTGASSCQLGLLDLRDLKSAGALRLSAQCSQDPATDLTINLESLTQVEDLNLDLGAYFSAGNTMDRGVDIAFPVLSSLGNAVVRAYSEKVTQIAFPALQTVSESLSLYFQSYSLQQINFPLLSSVGGTLFILSDLGSSSGVSLERIDFSSLTSVGYDIDINAAIPVVSKDSGLIMPQLSLVGTESGGRPNNGGQVTLCTGVVAANQQSYDNAACGIVSTLTGAGYSGIASTCRQCVAPEPPQPPLDPSTVRSGALSSIEVGTPDGVVPGLPQEVCLNSGSPANCPAGATVFGYSGEYWSFDTSEYPAPCKSANWIWAPGTLATTPYSDDAAYGFLTYFEFDGNQAQNMNLYVAADNSAVVYLNEVSLATVTTTSSLTPINISEYLQVGTNELYIEATNGSNQCSGCDYTNNPAGLFFCGGPFSATLEE